MDRQKMLQEIYENIGDKNLSIGCSFEENTSGEDGLLYKHTIIEVGTYGRDTILECNGEKILGHIPFSYNDKNREPSRGIIKNIIGHPISLSRVLSAFGDEYVVGDGHISIREGDDCGNSFVKYICSRELFTGDGSDAMLDSQSPETIKAIRDIVCK